MSEVQIKECHNVKILADLTHSTNIEETIKKIREKTKNWSNLEKYEFLKAQNIIKLDINPEAIKKANEVIAHQLYCDIEPLRKPWLKKICLVGDMRSGKSTQIEWFVELVLSIYRQDYEIFIIDSNSLQYNLDNLEAADIVIIITDDAVELQGSGQYMAKASQKLAAKYYKIAHEYVKRTGRKKTFIIAIFATQRWKDLDPRFRAAHITIFKNVLNTPEENKFLHVLFDDEDFNILENHTILRNFNLPEFGSTYAYFINARYRGISEFPLPKIELDKIDIVDAKLGGVNENYKVMDIMNQFYRDFGLKIRWDDIATIFGNEKLGESYRIAFQRWHKQNFSSYAKHFNEIIKDPYYLNQLKRKKPRRTKRRIKARNINEEIEKATKEELTWDEMGEKYGILSFNDIIEAASIRKDVLETAEKEGNIAGMEKLVQYAIKGGKSREEIHQALLASLQAPDEVKKRPECSRYIYFLIDSVNSKLKKGGN